MEKSDWNGEAQNGAWAAKSNVLFGYLHFISQQKNTVISKNFITILKHRFFVELAFEQRIRVLQEKAR